MKAAHGISRTDFLSGSGEMGALIRAFDWQSTPLGPIEYWPQSLKTCISLILGSSHPMWIGWGPEMTFLYNDAYVQVLGSAKHPHALGRPASEVWQEIWDVCGPLADRVFREGEAAFADNVQLFMDRGGFLEETFYSFSYSPIRGGSGETCGLFCPSTDVTARVLAARRLETLSELAASSLTARTSRDACAASARILAANPNDIPCAQLFLISDGSPRLEQSIGAFGNNGDPASPWPIAEVLSTGQRRTIETGGFDWLPRGLLNRRVTQAVALPLRLGGEQQPFGVLIAGVNPCRKLDSEYATFFDLIAGQLARAVENARYLEHEIKRADALREIDRAKTAFFSNVSHEIRTPLTLLLGPLESLLAGTDDLSPSAREQLKVAHSNSLRLLRLVNSLLDFSRLEAGRIQASYSPLDLSALTADLASSFASAMQAAGLNFIVECDPLPQPVYVDREMWEKIVLNLLSNAFKFTFEGSVKVSVGAAGDAAELSITDTGTGIPESELPRIFERFHRIEGSRGRTHEGTGIGLALVQELVKLHGGSISVTSREGQGSCFRVRIPFGASHLPQEQLVSAPLVPQSGNTAAVFAEEAFTWLHGIQGSPPPKGPARTARRPVVLLADDNADMRRYIQRTLGDHYEIVTASDGVEALDLLRRSPPDILVTDVMMPGLDGLRLLKAIRSDPATESLPVIFLSARAGEEMKVEGLEAGADDYLTKPFTANELRARIGAHLHMAELRRRASAHETTLRTEAQAAHHVAETLNEVARTLASELDLERLLQVVTDAAVTLTGARFGAYFQNVTNAAGDPYVPYTLSGASREDFERFGLRPGTRLFEPTLRGMVVSYRDLPSEIGEELHLDRSGEPPVRSYLAVPVISRSGAVLGGLFLGHPEAGFFGDEAGRLAAGTAAHAAIAIDNAQLFAAAEHQVLQRKQVEVTLRESERRFRAMIDSLPAAVFTTDWQGRLTHFNPALLDLMGLEPPFGSRQWSQSWKLMHADLTPVLDVMAALSSPTREELIAERPDGSRRWFIPYPTSLKDAEGAIVGSINMLVDITDRKVAQEALRQSEERFRRIFESSAVGIAIFTPDGPLLQANQAYSKITGYGEEELPELNFISLTHPEDRPSTLHLIQELTAGRVPGFALETRCLHRTGVTVWVNTSVSVLRDSAGKPEYLIAVCEDVTARKEAERSLRESEERFRAIVETSPECVAVISREGIVLHMNSSGLAIVGASEVDQVAGTSVYDIIAPEFRDAYRKFHEEICGGSRGSLEYEITGLDGERRRLETHAAPFVHPDKTLGQLSITRDITSRQEAEKATRLLRAIVDSSDDAVISKDLNGIITSWNTGAERVFGYTASEMIGQSITRLIPPGYIQEEAEILRKIKQSERIQHFESVRRRKDGTVIDVSLTISPVKDSQGKIIGASKIARDISENKRSENAIQALNAQLRTELSAMIKMQRLSRLLVAADDFRHLLDEIIDAGINITRADSGSIQLLEPESGLRVFAHHGLEPAFLEYCNTVRPDADVWAAVLERGERILVEDLNNPGPFCNGKPFEAMAAAGIRGAQFTPLVSRSGKVLGIFSTYFAAPGHPGERELRLLDVLARQAADLIEREQSDVALLASEARFRQLADAMPQIVWSARPDGYVDYYNERWYEFTGFERSVSGDDGSAILHPGDVERSRQAWRESVETGNPFHIEYRFWDRSEKRWRWFMGRALPVRGEDGSITRWFGSCTDIDDQKRVEEELRRANADLEQFAYSASHDLQEPLRSIKIYSELLTRRYRDRLDGQALEFCNHLRAGATRLELLVRDFLAYTHVSKLEAPQQNIDLTDALREALANLNVAIAESGARITWDPLPALPIHSSHLTQLFQNLISNAVKYRTADRVPEVHVSAACQGSQWILSVQDNGIGIEPQYQERIFGLFKRLHSADEYSGTGIGLAICQRIVERYGGRIWVESQPGEGSTFRFTFPA